MRIFHIIIKMSLASVLTTLIAQRLGLEYAITGGILAILSIQLTKKDSLLFAFKRMIGAFIALGLASIVFLIIGYTYVAFVMFTILFLSISYAIKNSEGIVPSLVLASHLLIVGTFSWTMILNGILLIAIAILMALSINIFYPQNPNKVFFIYIKKIDQMLADHIFMLSLLLKDLKETEAYFKHFEVVNQNIKDLIKQSELLDKDLLFDNDHRYINYLKMRHVQLGYINQIYGLANRIEFDYPHTKVLSSYINKLSFDIGCYDKASHKKEELQELLLSYKKSDLPKTRDEFETRAILYQMMFELNAFLDEKIAFHQRYPDYTCKKITES